jgi:hypothetical protein
LDDLEFLFMSTRRGQPNSNFDAQQQLRTSQIVQNLEINNSLMHWARDLTTRHSPTDLHPKLFFHMPFYTDFQVRVADSSYDRPALSHKPGVVYEWRRRMPLGEAFVITANIHPRSHLSKCLAEAVSAVRPDSTDDLFRKVVLRALVGLDAGVETDQLNELARYVNVVGGPSDLRTLYLRFESRDELEITISAWLMAWLCQDWGASGQWQTPPNQLPRPLYAQLSYAVPDLDSPDWGIPESKLLWEKALDKMSRVTSAVIEHALKKTADPPDDLIFIPPRPFRPVGSPIQTTSYTIGNFTSAYVTVRSTEIPWYAVRGHED